MPKLILSPAIFGEINAIVHQVEVETGMRLVGVVEDDRYVVRHVIGPGKNALQQMYDYECDNDYAEEVFNTLLKKESNLKWLGELHVHPSGFPLLSRTDRKTIREVLTGTDDVLHPEEFIAGVIQRENGSFRVHPFVFTKTNLQGEELEVIIHGTNICTQPGRTPGLIRQVYRCCRVRQRWWRHCRHRRADRRGKTHPH